MQEWVWERMPPLEPEWPPPSSTALSGLRLWVRAAAVRQRHQQERVLELQVRKWQGQHLPPQGLERGLEQVWHQREP